MHLAIGSHTNIRTEECSWVDVSCRMDEAVAEYLFRMEVIRFLHKLRTCLAIMLEVSILASKLVLMPTDISEKLALLWIYYEGKGFLTPTSLEEHQHVT